MKKQLSDEQLDALMRTLVKDASADESLIDEIAAAPQIWWSIQRSIGEKKARKRPLLSSVFRKWLMFGVPAAAAVLFVIGFFSFRPSQEAKTDLAGLHQNEVSQTAKAPIGVNPEPAVRANNDNEIVTKAPKTIAIKRTSITTPGAKQVSRRSSPANVVKTEIKSDFIALSNVGNPESGQIVRVKVPSSMMVSLGLVQSVAKPSDLIDAEVVVGDDGMNHAIRFIRQ